MKPPIAEKILYTERRHGREVSDPYRWLRDDRRSDARVLAYLEAENAYTAAVMQPTEALRNELYDEMVARIKEDDASVPERIGDYLYYTRTEKGKEYRYHCRKRGSLDTEEELLLDESALARGHDFFRLGAIEVSPDHNLLAYSVNTDGSEIYTIRVKDLRTGQDLPDEISDTYYSLEWAADSRTLFYDVLDRSHRPFRLKRHVLGTDPRKDDLVFDETDEAFFVNLYKTKSKRYLMLYLESNTTTEVWFLDAHRPAGEFRLVQARRPRVEYSVEHHGDDFYVLTNDEAVNFRLMRTAVATPQASHWVEVIPHSADVRLEGIEVFAGHVAVVERTAGLGRIRIFSLPDWVVHDVGFPEPVYAVAMANNPEFETDTLRFIYESPVTPQSVFDYDMNSGERELKKEQEVLGGYDRSRYRAERVFAEAPDGTAVPVSLVYAAGIRRDGKNPLLLYGYGSYGVTIEAGFDSTRLSLLDRGFVYAIAHVRGGSALGRPWYENGKLLHKRNTFTDFIACAEYLIARGYTEPGRLVIRGGSAGGLLMGAVVNMHPDLFSVVVAKVPSISPLLILQK